MGNHSFHVLIILLVLGLSATLLFSFTLLGDAALPAKPAARLPISPLPSPSPTPRPLVPPVHILDKGETLNTVAVRYGLPAAGIAYFNRITDTRRLQPGTRLLLPEGIRQVRNVSLPGEISRKKQPLPHGLTISTSVPAGKLPLTVTCAPRHDFADSLACVWDFGDGRYAFTRQARQTYLKPGQYELSLTLLSSEAALVTPPVIISVKSVNWQTTGELFLTADFIGQQLDLTGFFTDSAGKPLVIDKTWQLQQDPALLAYLSPNKFLTTAAGYTHLRLISETAGCGLFLFVSPFPSQHSAEPPYNWYKTQFDTGMYGNCGPACVAMAVHWATGRQISVVESRQEIGLPIKSGAISLQHMQNNFNYHRIPSRFTEVEDFNGFRRIIDRGNLAIIIFDTTYIQPVKGDETLVFSDRYYPDTTGHYVVIKGYSLDYKYLIVYDPIPGDWQSNSLRYTDGVSMIGRNRYFLTGQVLRSLKGNSVLEVMRK